MTFSDMEVSFLQLLYKIEVKSSASKDRMETRSNFHG